MPIIDFKDKYLKTGNAACHLYARSIKTINWGATEKTASRWELNHNNFDT